MIKAFPQHGPGKKHSREIALEDWQKNIIKTCTKKFIRGLIHSDGCRYMDRGQSYYTFTNISKDIVDLFCWSCNLENIKYKINVSKAGKYDVRIRTKLAVKALDKFVGSKS